MIVKRMPLADLNPSAYNPRKVLRPGDKDFDNLVNSIQAFGNVEPIVWNEVTGNIIGGHQRYAVLRHMGETMTDVVVVRLEEDEERFLNIALNKIRGKWNYDKLSETLAQFGSEEAKLTGFSAQEIMLLVAEANDKVSESLQNAGASAPPIPDPGEFFPGGGTDFAGDGPQEERSEPYFLPDSEDGPEDFEDNLPGEGEGVADDFPTERISSEGISWSVYLKFPSRDSALRWMEKEGIEAKLQPGWTTLVVRMGEDAR